jgi:CRP-like cAMP-binding protein
MSGAGNPISFPILENPRCSTESCPKNFLAKGSPISAPEITVTSDRVIYSEGQVAQSLFCIRKGAVKIYKTSHGRQVLVDVILAGGMVGAIHQESHYSETVEALSGAEICQLSHESYARWMKESGECLKLLFEQTANMLVESRVRQVLMSKLSAIERLSYFIARFATESLKLNPNQTRLMVPFKLSRADYADLVGTSVESVVRMLKELCERDILKIRAKEIEIKNFPKLKEVAGIGR